MPNAAVFVATMHQPVKTAATSTPLTTTEAVVLLAILAALDATTAWLVLSFMREQERQIDEIFNREP